MSRSLNFVKLHWLGQLPLFVSVVLILIGGHILTLFLMARFQVGLFLAAMIIVAMIWQVTGSLRAADQQMKQGDPLPGFATYAAALIVVLVTAVQVISQFLTAPDTTLETDKAAIASPIKDGVYELIGTITFDHYAALEQATKAGIEITTLRLESDGGLIHAARGIARLVRQNQWLTEVTGNCFSACPLIFVSGAERRMGPDAQLGFHQYGAKSIDRDSGAIDISDIRAETAKDRAYYAAQGIAPEFLDRIFASAHNRIWIPTRADLIAAGFIQE